MKDFKKFDLDFDRTIGFFLKKISWGNTLSKTIMNEIDLRIGSFFTLTSKKSDLNYIYQFSTGGVHSGQDLLNQYISENLDLNGKLKCVFEDVQSDKEDLPLDVFTSVGHLFESELYYIIDKSNKNKDMTYSTGLSNTYLQASISHSRNFWRELCLLSEFDFDVSRRDELNLDLLTTIVRNIRVIALSCYDGEGQIYWEKSEIGTNS